MLNLSHINVDLIIAMVTCSNSYECNNSYGYMERHKGTVFIFWNLILKVRHKCQKMKY